ncbi:LysR family transcriptional regulator [Dorea longicatena]|uniref:LysR family transcriptional regulator n=1 Tax=Dorea longicatena TaxID=88431 RepID=UPI001D0231AC|nr:LysR family transcriptional regulator [Dorea longicatena]MCB5534917.1 LysR family transcriptional regulator [bacterium MSK17_88]MCB5545281.1 LysR family transcriptional regulator [Dorea longicatena]MCG4573229.1 LysR family transcriptional regulator [Dorea longicatena]
MFVWKKYVYEVYKERSFTKAAQNLYISQPSLSARIKKIEEIIGEPLFDRSTTPLQLTEVGKVYIEAAEEITQIEQRVENYINDLAGLKTGNLAVGASTLFAAYVVPSLITQFNQKFPDVHIQLIEGNTAELEEMLGSNALDFVIDNYHYDSILYNKELYCEENILLAVPKHFAVNEELGMYQLSYKNIKNKNYLNQKYPAVPLGKFADLPFIMLTQGNDTRTRGDRLCRNVGFKPNIVLEFNQQSTAYMASSTQLGATFISDILVSQLPTFENLVYYKLDGEEAKRKVFFYYKTHKYKTRVMEEFIRMMHEQI